MIQLARGSFAGLGATDAVSGAFADNASSLRVSEKLGYQADGIERLAARGQVTITHRLRPRRSFMIMARNG